MATAGFLLGKTLFRLVPLSSPKFIVVSHLSKPRLSLIYRLFLFLFFIFFYDFRKVIQLTVLFRLASCERKLTAYFLILVSDQSIKLL